jgi:hypothetical protein
MRLLQKMIRDYYIDKRYLDHQPDVIKIDKFSYIKGTSFFKGFINHPDFPEKPLVIEANLKNKMLNYSIQMTQDINLGNFKIFSKPYPLSGSKVLDTLFNYIGVENIDLIYSSFDKSNLSSFNYFINKGMSIEDAVKNTFSGKHAVKNGFSDIDVPFLKKGLFGYNTVVVHFYKN